MRSPVVRRSLAATLSLLLACTAACQRTEQGRTEVTVIGEDAPAIADPAAGPLTEPQAVLLSSVAQGLVRFDPSGQIVPGLAERWNVTDDGLSYIFRLQAGKWPDGRKITAQQVARLLRRQIGSKSSNTLKDTLGAVDEIVAMTDRVLEISLKAPRPNLLPLLAQPEFALVYENQGSGPFRIGRANNPHQLHLFRSMSDLDEEVVREDEVVLGSAPAPAAVRAFVAGQTDLVLGGTYADLAYARAGKLPRNALRFDPAAGLFGLVPAKLDSPVVDVEFRRLLSESIDRQAVIDALDIPGLLPRATVLEPGLDGMSEPLSPEWSAVPLAERRAQLTERANRLFGGLEKPTIRIALPNAPGAKIMLNRLASDWGAIGITVQTAGKGEQADFTMIDLVAPSSSAAWYLRQFRCERVRICDEAADELLDGARNATVPAQRFGLLAQAAELIDSQQLFIPIAAPIRWSLVSDRVQGFATNRYARHSLAGLRERLDRNGAE